MRRKSSNDASDHRQSYQPSAIKAMTVLVGQTFSLTEAAKD